MAGAAGRSRSGRGWRASIGHSSAFVRHAGYVALLAGALLLVMAGRLAAAPPIILAAVPDLTWVRTGGPIGGMGYDIRMRPDDPDTILVTDAESGVYRSTDGGATWQPSNSGITVRTGTSGDAIPVFSLTIDPHDNDIVWAGTQNLRGIFRSSDGGVTWEERDNGVVESHGITFRGFTVDPRSSDIVYAAAELSSYQWNSGRQKWGRNFDLVKGVVYKTTDGGAKWKAVWRGDNLARYIWIDPSHPDTVYVSTGIFDREAANSNPSDAAKATPGGEGILKSTDGGLTWSHANKGLGNLYVGSLFMNPNNPQILLAATCMGVYQAQTEEGVYLSTDGGASWTRTLAEGINSVEFSLSDPRVAYAAGEGHVYRSVDGGVTWRSMTGAQWFWGPPRVAAGVPIDIQVDPRNPDRLFVNNYNGGNLLSEDGGATWSVASRGYTGAQDRDIAVDPVEPGRVLTAGRSGLFASLNGGTSWGSLGFPPDGYNEFNAVVIDPEDGRHILAANDSWGQLAESRDGGQSWVLRDSGLLGKDEAFSFCCFAFAPSDVGIVYAGTKFRKAGVFDSAPPSRGMYVSRDGGKTWAAANDATSASVQAADIAVHPADPEIAYVAALNNGLLRTTNGGKSWIRLAGDWPIIAVVRAVVFSPTDPQTIFVATNTGMFRSSDSGTTWQHLTAGLPPEAQFTSIAVDETNPQVLYVGDLRSGVYRTENGGDSWVQTNQGLRTRAVNRLALSSDGQHLYAATEGEGVFRLDLNGSPPEIAAPQFSDVPATYPYAAQISDLASRGVVGGFVDGTFRPEAPVTRQQFAKMIVKALGLSITGAEQCPFADVARNLDANDPLYPDKYVAVCAAHGITTGKTSTAFNPAGNVTRAQLITMVARAANLPDPPADYTPDFPNFSPDHYPWVRKAAYAALLDGLEGLGPGYDFLGPATRAEVCVLLYNLLHR